MAQSPTKDRNRHRSSHQRTHRKARKSRNPKTCNISDRQTPNAVKRRNPSLSHHPKKAVIPRPSVIIRRRQQLPPLTLVLPLHIPPTVSRRPLPQNVPHLTSMPPQLFPRHPLAAVDLAKNGLAMPCYFHRQPGGLVVGHGAPPTGGCEGGGSSGSSSGISISRAACQADRGGRIYWLSVSLGVLVCSVFCPLGWSKANSGIR